MNKEAQRIAIAEACGWLFKPDEFGWSFVKPDKEGFWWKYGEGEEPFPDYLSDLNAMHDVEKRLTVDQKFLYYQILFDPDNTCDTILKTDHWHKISATAAQWAEAFLKTIGRWKAA